MVRVFWGETVDKFLRDGGTALFYKAVTLPPNIMLTEEALAGQPLTEYVPGHTLISQEIFGYLFSFLVPMLPDQIDEHLLEEPFLHLTGFKAGRMFTAATGERFRAVFCEVLKR